MDEKKEKGEDIKKTCYGCINFRPGQRDHMEVGGCLYVDSDTSASDSIADPVIVQKK